MLRHVVLFGFDREATEAQVAEIVRRFAALHEVIAGIEAFEWGLNESPEALSAELTHCFMLTFHSADARDAYLVDPMHTAFADWVRTWVRHVAVVDYWIVPGS